MSGTTTKYKIDSCKDGFYLNNNTCKPNACDGFTSTSASIPGCKTVSPCQKGDTKYFKCDSCSNGYTQNASYTCDINPCTGFLSDKANIAHCKTVSSCLKGNKKVFKCDACANGYSLSASNTCTDAQCDPEFSLTACPQHATCSSCLSGNTKSFKITSCNTGFHVNGNVCESDCDFTGYPVTSCVDHGICSHKTCGGVTRYHLDSCESGYVSDDPSSPAGGSMCICDWGEYTLSSCPTGNSCESRTCLGQTKYKVNQTAKPNTECEYGDFYFADDTCSDTLINGKTPIGLVANTDTGLVAQMDYAVLPWNDGSDNTVNIPGLQDYPTGDTALTDRNGETNTDTIVAYAQSSGKAHQAAQYCHNKTTGGKTWFLPNYAEVRDLYPTLTFYDRANDVEGINYLGNSNAMIFSSTEYDKDRVSCDGFLNWNCNNNACICDKNYTGGDMEIQVAKCAFRYKASAHSSPECNIGDIYYADDTCSPNVESGKTAIGVVFDTTYKLVMSLDYAAGLLHWHDGTDNYQDIPGLNNYTGYAGYTPSSNDPTLDMNGKANTDIILAFAQSSGQAHQAAQYCHDMTTGGKTWYLPSYGELYLICKDSGVMKDSSVCTAMKAAYRKLGKTALAKYIYSSTEYSEGIAWNPRVFSGPCAQSLSNTKLNSYTENIIYCIFSYAD